jgi:hypothetical protein
MTSLVLTTTAVVSSKLAAYQTLPAAFVSEFATKKPLTVPQTAVAVANTTWAAADPHADAVVAAVPQDADEIVCLVYAPALDTSDQDAITAADEPTVDAVNAVNSPTHVLAGPVPPFGAAA